MYSNYGDLWEAVQGMIRDYGAEKGIHSAISTIGEQRARGRAGEGRGGCAR